MFKRIQRVREWLNEKGLDGVYITSAENRTYFSGFTGSNGHLFITLTEMLLITDARYTEQAEQQVVDFHVLTHGLHAMLTIKAAVESLQVRKLGYETDHMTDADVRTLRLELPGVEWLPTEDCGLKFRSVKDAEELSHIRTAIHIADQTILKLVQLMKPGMTEREIQIELEYLLAKAGSENPAFGTIVASGKRSSLPHGTVTDKRIEPGEMVVIDFGAVFKGYRSDLTRTVWVGVPEPEILHVFHIVLKAQEAAIRVIKPGMTGGEIDRAHREVFIEAGMEPYSLRGLGHGVGLQIHELPRIVMDHAETVEPGMVFTVEPGLYIPDVGGVRTEDIVLVTSDGCEVLTRCPKILQVH
jgi:Xaa-Pro aminopeptidase